MNSTRPIMKQNNHHSRRRQRATLKSQVVALTSAVAWIMTCSSLTADALSLTSRAKLPTSRSSLTHSRPSSVALCMAPISPSIPTSASSSSSSSSPQTEFELQVGRNLDTLRQDYPTILTDPLDYTIYDESLEVVDPSGVTVHGITSYKNTFRLLHTLVKFIYCPSRSSITFRMCYDKARQNIRIHWNAQVVPREIFGGERTTLYVDGISVYGMNADGKINQHRIEQLLMNQTPVQPKEGVFAAIRREHTVSVPSFAKETSTNVVVPFTPQFFVASDNDSSQNLFAMEAASQDQEHQEQHPGLDWDALDRKNKSRKKFGLQPMTPEEFLANEAQVQQLAVQQQQKQQQQLLQKQQQAAENAQSSKKKGLFSKLLGEVLQDTCESNFDCQRPEVCCDFGFKKTCCSSGNLVGLQQQPQMVPVPVVAGYPPEVRKNY